MIPLAIAILWVAIGAVVIAGVIFLGLKAFKLFAPVDGRFEQGIWLIYLMLVIIYLLLSISGHAPQIW